MKHIAIIMAGGTGSRMGASCPKQYLELNGKPILFYTISAFEGSFFDEIILVTRAEDIEYCRKEIVDKYGFKKISQIVAGGAQRSDSVFNGISAVKTKESYIYIHDGARPFIEDEVLQRVKACVMMYNACVTAVPEKNTIKMITKEGYVAHTPDRSTLWNAQTPQAFRYDIIMEAYERKKGMPSYECTDDAMVVELFGKMPVKVVDGDYKNIKITTPEDMEVGEKILQRINKKIV